MLPRALARRDSLRVRMPSAGVSQPGADQMGASGQSNLWLDVDVRLSENGCADTFDVQAYGMISNFFFL
jgi:hypothetical protein